VNAAATNFVTAIARLPAMAATSAVFDSEATETLHLPRRGRLAERPSYVEGDSPDCINNSAGVSQHCRLGLAQASDAPFCRPVGRTIRLINVAASHQPCYMSGS
jgi:hypothetical protein